jgi:hypothetical protein
MPNDFRHECWGRFQADPFKFLMDHYWGPTAFEWPERLEALVRFGIERGGLPGTAQHPFTPPEAQE